LNAAHQRGDARNSCAIRDWQRMKQCELTGDERGYMDARTRLFKMFERVSFSYVRHLLSNKGLSQEDLLQECRIAVLQAIDGWDVSRGELPTLLYYYTHKRVREYLRQNEIVQRPYSIFVKHWQETSQGRNSETTAPIRVDSCTFKRNEHTDDDSSIVARDYDKGDTYIADPKTSFDDLQLSIAVDQALDYLSPEDRQSVALHFGLDGYQPHSYRAMEPLIHATYQTAKNRVQKALPVLAAVLEGIR
jgi:RNA polymerase sigma factor (sigma-70 family)